MIEILASQTESDRAFRLWADALVGGSSRDGDGWVIEGRSIYFSNYGHGDPGIITSEVMLGADPEFNTAIGRDQKGNLLILRMGWLKKNALSRSVKDDFISLSGLAPVNVTVLGAVSKRAWFIVANLADSLPEIVAQTVDFTLACARARTKAGGGSERIDEKPYNLGLDEEGRTMIIEHAGGSVEVCKLHAYVWQALKRYLGGQFVKYTRDGFEVDAVVRSANLLIEIKTGVLAHDIYEAVGQLQLYPALIGLEVGLDPVILVPSAPRLKPIMAAALHSAGIDIYTYSVGNVGQKPKIAFSSEFLKRCQHQPSYASRSAGSNERERS